MTSQGTDVKSELRGSGLLLAGRFVAIGLNFLVQVVIVRFLTREAYGSLSFVLSATALAGNLNLMGLARSMSRFGPLYGEDRASGNLVGAILVSLGTVTALGMGVIGAAFLFQGHWEGYLTDNLLSQELLLLLIALTPLTAIDAILEVVTAAFAGARAIFFRRHVLTPVMRLGAVFLVILLGQGVRALAVCYLVTAVIGVLAYVAILIPALKEHGSKLKRPASWPAAPVLGYGLSMLLLDVAGVSILHLPAVVLEFVRGANEVAGLRAVVPLATLVLVVFQSMKLLYVPLATRSFERGGKGQLTEAYWSATTWIGLLSFPVFAVCVFLSPLAVTTLFGEQYADASSLAAIMSIGYYLHAILGINTLTLQALGESRSLRITALAGIVTAVITNAILIPLFGAVGAAIATTATLLAHDFTNAFLVWKHGQIGRPPEGFFRPYKWILGVTTVLFFAVTLTHLPPWLAVLVVAGGILAVWQSCRASLNLLETFPELARLPLLRKVLA
ncbi:Polysaccharide biosynthesis protein [Planctomycetes bacterium Poly30]|uniref:Polysaccharide biosynthesis protein n=1 Tax=Saltatorellus ferox TaxID=2528018 RepID=A0A518EM77_9BACT|nr:Polysaccharide biosynthesis protein [Planctomycetes bacterium Poly30]